MMGAVYEYKEGKKSDLIRVQSFIACSLFKSEGRRDNLASKMM